MRFFKILKCYIANTIAKINKSSRFNGKLIYLCKTFPYYHSLSRNVGGKIVVL